MSDFELLTVGDGKACIAEWYLHEVTFVPAAPRTQLWDRIEENRAIAEAEAAADHPGVRNVR